MRGGKDKQAMNITTKQYFFLSISLVVVALGLLFGVARFASASEILYSEVTSVTNITRTWATGGSTSYNRFNLTNLVPHWAIDRVDWYIDNFNANLVANADDNFIHGIIRDSTGTIIATSTNTENFTAGPGYYSFYFDPAVFLRTQISDDDVRVGIQVTGDGSIASKSFQVHTSGQNNIPNWDYFDTQGNATTSDPVMTIYGVDLDEVPEGGSVTRIISQDEPDNGELAPSSVVPFQFTYFNNDTDDDPVTVAGVDIRDVSSGFQYVPLEEPIIVSGEGSFSQIQQLTEGHFHMWRPYLRNASSTRFVRGSWYSFDVVDYSGQFDPLDPDADSATSTALGRFFSQQGYLASKFPFAYFYDVAGIVSLIDDDSTEGTFPSLSFSMGSSSPIGLGSFDMYSSSTLSAIVGSSAVSFIRTMMGWSLWLVFAYAVYRQIHRLV